ncbi:cytochrome c4, partial [mine drainage metagenome]
MRGVVLLALLALGVSDAALASGKPGARPAPATEQPKVSTSLRQRIAGCIACHGPYGQGGGSGGFAPRIGGKPAGYLYHQLQNFRDGRRVYPLMTWMVQYLPDPYMKEIAQYFSDQSPPPPAPQTPMVTVATLDTGRKLATMGDPARGLPACMACHGSSLMGVQPDVPGLIGLSNDYISAQLGAFKQAPAGPRRRIACTRSPPSSMVLKSARSRRGCRRGRFPRVPGPSPLV